MPSTRRLVAAAVPLALLALVVVTPGTQADLEQQSVTVRVRRALFDSELRHNIADLDVVTGGRLATARFLAYYEITGGFTRWGHPTSELFEETPATLTQYFQRGVLDWKPSPWGGGHAVERRLAWDHLGGGAGGATDLGVEPDLRTPHDGDLIGP